LFNQLAIAGIGMVISDHHVDQLLSIGSRVYVMIGGEVITTGSVRDILADERTRDLYLGNRFYTEMNNKFFEKKD